MWKFISVGKKESFVEFSTDIVRQCEEIYWNKLFWCEIKWRDLFFCWPTIVVVTFKCLHFVICSLNAVVFKTALR